MYSLLYSQFIIHVAGPSSPVCSLYCISNKGCQAAIFNSRTLICKMYKKATEIEVKSSSATDLVYLVTESARNMVSI